MQNENPQRAPSAARARNGNSSPAGQDLRLRTKRFALAAIELTESLPRRRSAEVIGKQLVRSATSVGANYRSACRARSKADFAAKMAIVLEEADETLYWLELLEESGLVESGQTTLLSREAEELVAISVASIKTARRPA